MAELFHPKISILSFKGSCFVVRCLDFGRFQPRQIPKVIPSPSPGRSWPRCATRIWRSSVRRIDPWPGTSMTSKLPAPGLGILEEMREMRDPKFPKFPKWTEICPEVLSRWGHDGGFIRFHFDIYSLSIDLRWCAFETRSRALFLVSNFSFLVQYMYSFSYSLYYIILYSMTVYTHAYMKNLRNSPQHRESSQLWSTEENTFARIWGRSDPPMYTGEVAKHSPMMCSSRGGPVWNCFWGSTVDVWNPKTDVNLSNPSGPGGDHQVLVFWDAKSGRAEETP